MRTCVGCRTRRPWTELVRVTRPRHGVAVDGPSAGRGAWVCRAADDGPDPACCEQGLRRGGFARAWRRGLDDADVAAIRRSATRNDADVAAIRRSATRNDADVRSVDEGMTSGKG